jgi:hypothetical protein
VSATVLAPVILLLVILTVAIWVYKDAGARRDSGRTVVVTIGSITIDTPEAWLAGCVVLSVLCIPLYLVARERA